MKIKRINFREGYVRLLMLMTTVVVGMAAVVPFFFSRREQIPGTGKVLRLIDTHDLWMHLFIMQEFDQVLGSGVIYPRWIPNINRGYGLLNMIYYPPGCFYITSLFHTVISDWHYVVFAVAGLALAGSGFALYFLARLFYSRIASAAAALFYMLIPFHMLDLYYRGALPQFIGYAFVPIIFYFVYRLGRQGRARYYAGLGLSFGLFLLTHLPVGLMLTYAIGFFALAWAYKEKDWRVGFRIALGMGLGLVLSAIYWLPAAAESRYAYEIASDWYPYHHYKSYITLLAVEEGTAYWTFWKLLNEVFVAHALAVLIPIIILAVMRKRAPEYAGLAKHDAGAVTHWQPNRMWITMGAVTIFMCTSLSIYVSKLLVAISVAVPAWRWLVISSVFASLLLAASIDLLRNGSERSKARVWACRALLGAMVAFNLWITAHGTILGALENYTYHPKAETTYDVIEPNWTPKGASLPQDLPDTPRVALSPEEGTAQIIRWDPQHREVSVKVDQPTSVRFRTYNFPGWTAYVDKNRVPMMSDKDGVMTVDVPAGIHSVEAVFQNSPPRTAGTVSFAFGLLTILGLTVVDRMKSRSALASRARSRSKGEDAFAPAEAEAAIQAGETEAQPAGGRRAGTLGAILSGKTAKLVAAGCACAVAIVIILLIARPFGPKPGGAEAPASERGRESRASVSAGSEVKVYIAGRDFVPVAADERSLSEVLQAVSTRNEGRVSELIQSGKSLRIDNDTKATILEVGTGKLKLRIAEGKEIMKEGWVPERWIH